MKREVKNPFNHCDKCHMVWRVTDKGVLNIKPQGMDLLIPCPEHLQEIQKDLEKHAPKPKRTRKTKKDEEE